MLVDLQSGQIDHHHHCNLPGFPRPAGRLPRHQRHRRSASAGERRAPFALAAAPKADGEEIELPLKSSRKTQFARVGGAKSGAIPSQRGAADAALPGSNPAPADPELAAVIDAWPMLPADARQAIVKIVQAALTRQPGQP